MKSIITSGIIGLSALFSAVPALASAEVTDSGTTA